MYLNNLNKGRSTMNMNVAVTDIMQNRIFVKRLNFSNCFIKLFTIDIYAKN